MSGGVIFWHFGILEIVFIVRNAEAMEAVAARNSQPHALAAHRSTLPLAAASREAVEAVQHQIQQQRKIIDRCKSENHTLREELQSRTKVHHVPRMDGPSICSRNLSCWCVCSLTPMCPAHMSRTSWHSSQTSLMFLLAKYDICKQEMRTAHISLFDQFLPQQVAGEEQQVESLQAQIRQCKDQVLTCSKMLYKCPLRPMRICMHALSVTHTASPVARAPQGEKEQKKKRLRR